MKVYNIHNLIKGFDEDGKKECFQRVGGRCETNIRLSIAHHFRAGGPKVQRVDSSRDYCVKV